MENDKKQILLEAYIAKATPMPTLPISAMRILELSKRDEADVEQIADEILKDKVLTARMIRLVNSVFWGIRRSVTSIREAIVYLGLHQIRSIVLTTSLFNTFPNNNPSFAITHIWEHGLGCAMISRSIANLTGYKDCEKAYIAGLMHDLGKVILSQFSVSEYDDVLNLVEAGNMTFYEAENQVLGINHTDFANWFKEHWAFSEELTEVISKHHEPENAEVDPALVSIVSLADLFCRVRGLDYSLVQYLPVSIKDEHSWKILVKNNRKLEKMDLIRFTLELDAIVEEVKKVVKEAYSPEEEPA